MKTKTNTKIALKKLTIAKISIDKMRKVNGGDCLPTEHYDERPSVIVCPDTVHVF